MTNFNVFISEVLTLRFERVYHLGPDEDVWSIDLSHYSDDSGYRARLAKLKESALTDILFLPPHHIKICISRLNHIFNHLYVIESINSSEHDKFYEENDINIFSSMKQGFDSPIIFDNESNFRTAPEYFNEESFVWDLRDAITNKRTAVENLLDDLEYLSVIATGDTISKVKEESKLTSYQWIDGNVTEGIRALYGKLNDVFINKIDFEDFKPLFSNTPAGSFTPLQWKSSNASELLFFITALMERGLVNDERGRMSYERLRSCFIKSDGSKFNEDFKSLKQRLIIDFGQNKQKIISDLFVDFL